MARIGLTQLPRQLAEHTGQPAPTYRKCFNAAVEARIPAQFAGNRWTVDDADVAQIATAMGLTAAKPVKSTRRASSALTAA